MKRLRLAASLLLALSAACSDSLFAPAASSDHAALFDELWTQVDLHYSFFELKQVDWNAMRTRYRPQAIAARSEDEFATALAAMLAELRDVHVSLTPTSSHRTLRYTSPRENTPTYFDSRLVFRRYVTAVSTSPTARVQYGMAGATVGYMYIPTFDGSWEKELDAAIAALLSRGAQSMIVDVRNNPGGRYDMARALAGRFADRQHVFGYVRRRNGAQHDDFTGYTEETIAPAGASRFGGHVYVLANSGSMSSAETFVLAMRSLPGVTIVGSTTAGASGGPIVRELANGWTYQLSEWIDYTASKTAFEDIGLSPDVAVTATASDLSKGLDPVLERALALAREAPSAAKRF